MSSRMSNSTCRHSSTAESSSYESDYRKPHVILLADAQRNGPHFPQLRAPQSWPPSGSERRIYWKQLNSYYKEHHPQDTRRLYIRNYTMDKILTMQGHNNPTTTKGTRSSPSANASSSRLHVAAHQHKAGPIIRRVKQEANDDNASSTSSREPTPSLTTSTSAAAHGNAAHPKPAPSSTLLQVSSSTTPRTVPQVIIVQQHEADPTVKEEDCPTTSSPSFAHATTITRPDPAPSSSSTIESVREHHAGSTTDATRPDPAPSSSTSEEPVRQQRHGPTTTAPALRSERDVGRPGAAEERRLQPDPSHTTTTRIAQQKEESGAHRPDPAPSSSNNALIDSSLGRPILPNASQQQQHQQRQGVQQQQQQQRRAPVATGQQRRQQPPVLLGPHHPVAHQNDGNGVVGPLILSDPIPTNATSTYFRWKHEYNAHRAANGLPPGRPGRRMLQDLYNAQQQQQHLQDGP